MKCAIGAAFLLCFLDPEIPTSMQVLIISRMDFTCGSFSQCSSFDDLSRPNVCGILYVPILPCRGIVTLNHILGAQGAVQFRHCNVGFCGDSILGFRPRAQLVPTISHHVPRGVFVEYKQVVSCHIRIRVRISSFLVSSPLLTIRCT